MHAGLAGGWPLELACAYLPACRNLGCCLLQPQPLPLPLPQPQPLPQPLPLLQPLPLPLRTPGKL